MIKSFIISSNQVLHRLNLGVHLELGQQKKYRVKAGEFLFREFDYNDELLKNTVQLLREMEEQEESEEFYKSIVNGREESERC